MSMESHRMHQVVRLQNLKSKPKWNNRLAQIIGRYSTEKQRYPVILIPFGKIAWIKPINFCIKSCIKSTTNDLSFKLNDTPSNDAESIILNDSNTLKSILCYLIATELNMKTSESIIIPMSLLSVSKHWRNTGSSLIKSVIIENMKSSDFKQKHLNYIANTLQHLTNLQIDLERDSNCAEQIDFTLIKFPKLKKLSIDGMHLKNMHFDLNNVSMLKDLSITHCVESQYIYLNLPFLKTFNCQESVNNDWTAFGNSISRCPKLEFLNFYGMKGLSKYSKRLKSGHVIINQSLQCVYFEYSDLDKIEMWAPCLLDADFEGSYNLSHVRLYKTFPTQYVEKNKFFVDYQGLKRTINIRKQSEVDINLTQTNIDYASLKHLKSNPRIQDTDFMTMY